MKKWIASLLCMAIVFGVCGTALAEDREAKQDNILKKVQDLLGKTDRMEDSELRDEIRKIAEEAGFSLTEKQLDRAVKVCRSMEDLNEEELRDRIEQAEKAVEQRLGETSDRFSNWIEAIENGEVTWEDAKQGLFTGLGTAAGVLSDFFGGVADYFSDNR